MARPLMSPPAAVSAVPLWEEALRPVAVHLEDDTIVTDIGVAQSWT